MFFLIGQINLGYGKVYLKSCRITVSREVALQGMMCPIVLHKSSCPYSPQINSIVWVGHYVIGMDCRSKPVMLRKSKVHEAPAPAHRK